MLGLCMPHLRLACAAPLQSSCPLLLCTYGHKPKYYPHLWYHRFTSLTLYAKVNECNSLLTFLPLWVCVCVFLIGLVQYCCYNVPFCTCAANMPNLSGQNAAQSYKNRLEVKVSLCPGNCLNSQQLADGTKEQLHKSQFSHALLKLASVNSDWVSVVTVNKLTNSCLFTQLVDA